MVGSESPVSEGASGDDPLAVLPYAPDPAPAQTHYPLIMERMRKTLDWKEYERIAAQAKKAGSEKKYLDIERWTKTKLEAAVFLGLHKTEGLSILDIGTGAGFFPYIAKYFNHSVAALDLPDITLYDDMCAWFGVEKRPFRVQAHEPLPAPAQRFDLVTAFMLAFNTKADGSLFTVEEWSAFLDDVRDNQLRPGGRLLLKMIRQQDRPGPKFRDPDLMELFASRGARFFSARHALFDPLL